MNIPVKIDASPDGITPELQGTFGRINVILGENGSGKSQLLLRLFSSCEAVFGGDFRRVRIEGGRAVDIPITVGMQHNPDVYSQVSNAVKEYMTSLTTSLRDRIHRTFFVLHALEDAEKRAHSDAVVEWMGGDRSGLLPERRTPPFARFIAMFASVFPELTVEISNNNQIYVRRNQHFYPASNLSDGEKQVFLLLADIAILERPKTVFFIDEPELNLHPTLALSLWETLERLHPASIFVYVTHSLSFALRPAVDSVWSIPHGQLDLSNADLQTVNIRPFIGAIGGIVKSNICLFVEGEDASFDRELYNWLLGRADIDVVAVGSSSEVIAAASRRSVWGQVSPQIKVAGVVDGDYGRRRNLEGISNVVQLPVREVESLLCEPAIVLAVHRALRNTGRDLGEDDIKNRLSTIAAADQLRTVAQRVFSEARVDLALSLERKTVGSIKSTSDLRSAIVAEATIEAEKAKAVLSAERVGQLFDDVEAECSRAIAGADVDAMLRLFDGKRALSELSKLAGCPTSAGMVSATVQHLDPLQFPTLRALRVSILSALGLV